jgi:hypothetical protein
MVIDLPYRLDPLLKDERTFLPPVGENTTQKNSVIKPLYPHNFPADKSHVPKGYNCHEYTVMGHDWSR